jgi:hypothetical protein
MAGTLVVPRPRPLLHPKLQGRMTGISTQEKMSGEEWERLLYGWKSQVKKSSRRGQKSISGGQKSQLILLL